MDKSEYKGSYVGSNARTEKGFKPHDEKGLVVAINYGYDTNYKESFKLGDGGGKEEIIVNKVLNLQFRTKLDY